MGAMNKLLSIAEGEVGYLEKKTNSQLDDKTANAGTNNYTKYGRDMGCNGQAWCDAFVDWCFVQAFGKATASDLLGGLSNYTPTSESYFKKMGRKYQTPQKGDIIFFKNSIRTCHTGIVYSVTSGKVYTYEGNTSDGAEVIPNGGAVCKKSYDITNSRISSYGRPDYAALDQKSWETGWHQDANGWWYANTNVTYLHDTFKDINGCRYYFNSDGYALTDWQEINGAWYYFEPRKGHAKECALYVTDYDGRQTIGNFE